MKAKPDLKSMDNLQHIGSHIVSTGLEGANHSCSLWRVSCSNEGRLMENGHHLFSLTPDPLLQCCSGMHLYSCSWATLVATIYVALAALEHEHPENGLTHRCHYCTQGKKDKKGGSFHSFEIKATITPKNQEQTWKKSRTRMPSGDEDRRKSSVQPSEGEAPKGAFNRTYTSWQNLGTFMSCWFGVSEHNPKYQCTSINNNKSLQQFQNTNCI